MKLKESIPPNSVKIIDLYNKIDAEILDTSPDFQRKLVWKKQHKYSFIDTILMNYPFPEVYIASEGIDLIGFKSKEIVVDGKQRLTAIVEYIKGINDFKNQTKIPTFEDLSTDDKKDFLNYLVTVKDLKNMPLNEIKEIFQRINSTEYSLNSIERTNALFGDGEFAVFCKQIVYSDYNPTETETDIVLDIDIKEELNNFFLEYDIFNENDKARMFDVQYIMLIVSTFLEGDYYGRSSKVNEYLEKYNSDFSKYRTPMNQLLNSIRIINKLKLSKLSYWFNKANLFTLIIELSKVEPKNLVFPKLELLLLDLETKVDLYFSDDEVSKSTEDEKKYFEVARQGSHEKASRIHRGKVIKQIINESSIVRKINDNLEFLKASNIPFSVLIPTETGLTKHIMDATSAVREFLKSSEIHDYDKQPFGPDNKKELKGLFVYNEKSEETNISLYRSNGRGDYRIWFSELKSFAKANDELALIKKDGMINILNLTNYDYSNLEA
jgi:hypothetical protein